MAPFFKFMNFPRGGTASLVKLEFSLLKQPLAGHMHEPPAETEFLQFFSFFFFSFFFSFHTAKQNKAVTFSREITRAREQEANCHSPRRQRKPITTLQSTTHG